jgi:hypothetical protein
MEISNANDKLKTTRRELKSMQKNESVSDEQRVDQLENEIKLLVSKNTEQERELRFLTK